MSAKPDHKTVWPFGEAEFIRQAVTGHLPQNHMIKTDARLFSHRILHIPNFSKGKQEKRDQPYYFINVFRF